MATFINGDVEEDIESVPGVGPAAAGLLAKVRCSGMSLLGVACTFVLTACVLQKGVNNTYQLIGVYLGLRENGESADPTAAPCCGLHRLCRSSNVLLRVVRWWLAMWAGMSMQDHHDAFLNFIIKAGIKNYRHGIVLAIAEKVSAMIPGLFSPDALEEHK